MAGDIDYVRYLSMQKDKEVQVYKLLPMPSDYVAIKTFVESDPLLVNYMYIDGFNYRICPPLNSTLLTH